VCDLLADLDRPSETRPCKCFTYYSDFLDCVNPSRYNIHVTRQYNQTCPVARTLDVIGDRWTLLIVRDLFLGKTRYQHFLDSSPGLPPRLLSDRLKRLEQHGLIERSIYSQHPLRAEYRLTERGRSLQPVMAAIVRWGIDNGFEPDERQAVEQFIAAHVPDLFSTPSA